MSPRTTRIILIRHGQTDWNVRGLYQGWQDVELNPIGREQAVQLGATLAATRIDAAYSSPLQRAFETARIALEGREIAIESIDELREICYGVCEGLTADERHAQWPEIDAGYRTNPWDVSFPNGESLHTVADRALPALHRIAERHVGQTVLVSAHGNLNRVLLAHVRALANDSPSARVNEGFWEIEQPNGVATVFDYPLADDAMPGAVSADDAQRAIDEKTKPLGALGDLERIAVRLATLQGTLAPDLTTARVIVFAGDHGVAHEGVSAYPPQVTAEMMRVFARGGAAVSVLARSGGIDVETIDVGVDADIAEELRALSAASRTRVIDAKVARGSRNIFHEPAMTASECERALHVGRDAVRRAARDGVRAVGLGEMGIGNTTSASALLAALTGAAVEDVVGRGTGVTDDGLAHKREVVRAVLARHADRHGHPRHVLAALGGFELAAIAGAVLEAPHSRVVMVADGFISTVAALAATRIDDRTRPWLFVAHESAELGHAIAIRALDTKPILSLRMRLGEGSGAALALPILRAAAAIMREMATFESAGVSRSTDDAPEPVTAAGHEPRLR